MNKLILLITLISVGCATTPNVPDVVDQLPAISNHIPKNDNFAELESTCLALMTGFASIGAIFLVVSTIIGGVGRNAGFVLIALSIGFGLAPYMIIDLVTNVWFKVFVYVLVTSAVLYAMWQGFISHREYKASLTPTDKPIE